MLYAYRGTPAGSCVASPTCTSSSSASIPRIDGGFSFELRAGGSSMMVTAIRLGVERFAPSWPVGDDAGRPEAGPHAAIRQAAIAPNPRQARAYRGMKPETNPDKHRSTGVPLRLSTFICGWPTALRPDSAPPGCRSAPRSRERACSAPLARGGPGRGRSPCASWATSSSGAGNRSTTCSCPRPTRRRRARPPRR